MPKKKQTTHKILIKWFLTGVAVFAPLLLTVWFGWWIVETTDTLFDKLVPHKLNPNNYLNFYIPGIGIAVTAMFFIILGAISRIFIGRWLLSLIDGIMNHLPVLKSIYKALRQLTDTFANDDAGAFREACLIQFPCEGEWSIGFVTGSSTEEIQKLSPGNDEMVNVYIPTTPNPTSGYLLFVPKKDIKILNMTSDEALKLIISGGIVIPEDDNSKWEK